MQTKDELVFAPWDESAEIQCDLGAVNGGASTALYGNLTLGLSPAGIPQFGHQYAMISEGFGQNVDYAGINDIIQRFNAPTEQSLFPSHAPQGNDPNATHATISQPYLRQLGYDESWGGQVSLSHHDGWARNQTLFLHPLEGQVSRHAVLDANAGQFEILTVGDGSGGFNVSGGLAGTIGARVGGPAGAVIASYGPQLAGHSLNPGLGFESFRQLDAAARTYAGIPDRYEQNFGNVITTTQNVAGNFLNLPNAAPVGDALTGRQAFLRDTVQHLQATGGVNGILTLNIDNTISRVDTATGRVDTFAPGTNGGVVALPFDEFRGLDAAIQRWGDPTAGRSVEPTPGGQQFVPPVGPDVVPENPLEGKPLVENVVPTADTDAQPQQVEVAA